MPRKLLALLLLAAPCAFAQTQQPQDPDYAAHVKEWTTKPEFSSPLVDHLPLSTTIPSPKTILGYDIGAPKKLTYYADVLKYYRALAAASPRVKIISLGKTEEDRESVMVFIGSEDSIRNLDANKKNLARLADPRGLSQAEATQIIASTKPIYTLSGGLHSAELGPPEMLMELAYRLAVEDSPLIQKVRDQVIVSILPAADPDGRDRNIDWYNKYLIDVTTQGTGANSGPPSVPYWGKYTRHDDNRDINYAGLANQHLLAWYLDWHPPVIHDLHESVPFLYIFSGQSPQNTFLDPILWDELPMYSNFEKARLSGYGMPGVWDHAYVDGWSPGYVAFMSSNHNGMMRFYEIYGNGGATTMHRTIGGGAGGGGAGAAGGPEAPATEPAAALTAAAPAAGRAAAAAPAATPAPAGGGGGGNYTTRQWYRPDPPYKDFTWSIRNNVNYAETGILTALELTSTIPQIVLNNFYLKSRNSIHTGETQAPYAYVIPADNEDPTRVAFAVRILRMQGIEVGRAKAAIKLSDGAYPAGSLIVKLNQPYGRLAHTLMSKQVDPDPELTTYDDAAWTLGLMTNTTIKESADKTALEIPVDPVDIYTPPSNLSDAPSQTVPSSEVGSHKPALPKSTTPAAFYAVPDHGSPNLITLRYALKDADIQIAEKSFKSGETTIPAGSFIVPAAAFDALKTAAIPLGLDAFPIAKPTVAMHKAALPRIAMFSTWSGTQDVGWVRYTFDQYKIPYDLLYKEQVLTGNLRAKYDILLIPTQARNAKQLLNDIPKTKTPYAYVKDEKFKFLGDYGSSEDISGGIGLAGLMEFQKFVSAGGLMVTLGSSSFLPPEYDLAPRIDATSTTPRFYAPGPIVEAQIAQPDNPIFYGYTEKTVPVRWAAGPLLRLDADEDRRETLLRFTGGDKAVLSGLMNGAAEITRRPAIVKTQLDKGEIVMFVTNPIWRNQNVGEYRMLFNTFLNFQNLDTAPPPAAAPGAATGAGGGRRNRGADTSTPPSTPPSHTLPPTL